MAAASALRRRLFRGALGRQLCCGGGRGAADEARPVRRLLLRARHCCGRSRPSLHARAVALPRRARTAASAAARSGTALQRRQTGRTAPPARARLCYGRGRPSWHARAVALLWARSTAGAGARAKDCVQSCADVEAARRRTAAAAASGAAATRREGSGLQICLGAWAAALPATACATGRGAAATPDGCGGDLPSFLPRSGEHFNNHLSSPPPSSDPARCGRPRTARQ
ncbi:hypothetical protein ACP4OV_016551 [Aristida adscensionis]